MHPAHLAELHGALSGGEGRKLWQPGLLRLQDLVLLRQRTWIWQSKHRRVSKVSLDVCLELYLDVPLTPLQQRESCGQFLVSDGGIGLQCNLLSLSKLAHV